MYAHLSCCSSFIYLQLSNIYSLFNVNNISLSWQEADDLCQELFQGKLWNIKSADEYYHVTNAFERYWLQADVTYIGFGSEQVNKNTLVYLKLHNYEIYIYTHTQTHTHIYIYILTVLKLFWLPSRLCNHIFTLCSYVCSIGELNYLYIIIFIFFIFF